MLCAEQQTWHELGEIFEIVNPTEIHLGDMRGWNQATVALRAL
jgi:hypothetical protein